jgi:hypothetical protein
MNSNHYKHKIYFDLLLGIFFSSILTHFIIGIKVLRPNFVNWLAIEDGKQEIGWEFFRNSPLFQFPIGLNTQYGLNFSSSIIYSDVISIYALLLKPFTVFLPDRFQYLGIAIFLNFVITFIISLKITRIYFNTRPMGYIYALLILISPITLHRIVDFAHYGLSANWTILAAIYLYLKKIDSICKWMILLIITSLIHIYYLPMILPIFVILSVQNAIKTRDVSNMVIGIISVFTTLIIFMYFVGYFSNTLGNLRLEGYGEYKSTLLSYLDPNGWSRFLRDIPGLKNNEGFAFIGLTQIFLILLAFVYTRYKKIKSQSFNVLLIFGFCLYLFSLTNSVTLTNEIIFSYKIPNQLSIFMEIFRSTGRFTWLLGYVLIIWSISIVSKIQNFKFSLLILVLIIFQLYDQFPKMHSQKQYRYNSVQDQKATDSIWIDVAECYDNIILYPYFPNVDDWYKYAHVAYRNNWGINSVLLARPNFDQAKIFLNELHFQFRTAQMSKKNVYVFSSLDWWSKDYTDREIKNLIRNLDSKDGYGVIDGNFAVFPNVKNCTNKILNLSYPINVLDTSPSKEFYFNSSTNDIDFLFENWSLSENWGTWSLGSSSSILLPVIGSKPESIIIHGQVFANNNFNKFSSLDIEINGIKSNNCSLPNNFISSCVISIPSESLDINSKNLYIEFEIKDYDVNNSKAVNDERELGIGLQKIEIN